MSGPEAFAININDIVKVDLAIKVKLYNFLRVIYTVYFP